MFRIRCTQVGLFPFSFPSLWLTVKVSPLNSSGYSTCTDFQLSYQLDYLLQLDLVWKKVLQKILVYLSGDMAIKQL